VCGAGEANLRGLFAAAIDDQQKANEAQRRANELLHQQKLRGGGGGSGGDGGSGSGGSDRLHIIIFDEIDAICRSRGHLDQTAGVVYDSMVNQTTAEPLLSPDHTGRSPNLTIPHLSFPVCSSSGPLTFPVWQVNQLLSLMDGVAPLDNALIVGLTNRKDLLDPALLRPGRFEVRT
jgi:hypothetical protein